MSSKKKKKNVNAQKNSTAKKTESINKDTAAVNDSTNDDFIPVQSFKDMLAFADDDTDIAEADSGKAEAKPEEPVKEEPKQEAKPAEPVKEEPKQEAKPAEPAKEEPKQEAKPAKEEPKQEAKPEEPVKEEPKQEAKPVKDDPKHADAAFKDASGMPISKEEAARQADALDALDRDLHKATMKKRQEEEFDKRLREQEKKKEADRMEKAEMIKLRHDNAQELAKKREQERAAKAAAENTPEMAQKKAMDEAKQAAKKQQVSNRKFNNTLLSMAAGKVAVVAIILLIGAYVGSFFYVDSRSESFFTELETKLTNKGHFVDVSNYEYKMPEASPFSYDAKILSNLVPWLPDSDKDGLSDYYESTQSKTDPLNPDCDGDGVSDGRELRAQLNPNNAMTDGVTRDNEVIRDATVAEANVRMEVKGIPKTAMCTVTKVSNNSIQGAPGLLGYAYEFYADKPFESCNAIFSYVDQQVVSEGMTENTLAVYRFDSRTLSFEKLESLINMDKNTVTAEITGSGIYALCDSSIVSEKGKTNIFFLIDNSGSMYPEALCTNSEENDVEFKRLDFANNLIDMLGTDASYGAAQFLGTYTNISPISGDFETVKQKISDIRNNVPQFTGTDIAGSLISAENEFGSVNPSDRNYIILLTDGMPTNPNPATEMQAIELAQRNGITIFTIGLGKKIDSEYLFNIAEKTNGQFFQASNADALENIYSKIQSFMSYNQVTIEENDNRKGYVIADCGFNVLKDGIGYNNFRADFAPDGTASGIAGLIRDYYTGALKMKEGSYTTDDGKEVPGYDISAIDTFVDGKTDLTGIKMDILNSYSEYLALEDKWNYRKVDNGVLQYTEKTRDFIDSHNLKVITSPYSFKAPAESDFMKMLRTITFKNIRDFTSYECVLIDSNLCQGDDLAIMNLLRWYYYLPNTDRCQFYDFGYEGDEAIDRLVEELNTGSPAVIDFGGTYMNAVRLIRDAENPNVYVIDAYDSNTPDRGTKITLVRTPVYDGNSIPSYQYIASRGSDDQSLKLVVTK